MPGQATHYELGKSFYIFTARPAGRPAPVPGAWSGKTNLILESHGGGHEPWFDLPRGMTVRFYAMEGEHLLIESTAAGNGRRYSATAAAVMHDRAIATDTYEGPCRCPNYGLSKFHLSDQTATPPAGRSRVTYQDIEWYVAKWPRMDFDLVTVRNRKLYDDPTLCTLAAGLLQNAHAYGTLHCICCRGNTLGAPARRIFMKDGPRGVLQN